MLSMKDITMHSSCSSLLTDDQCHDEVMTTLRSKPYHRRDIYLPNSTIFIISVHNNHLYQLEKKFSLDTPLISYAFLIRLINRTFNLHSNFTIQSKETIVIKDDFDLDGYIINAIHTNHFEFLVYSYEIDDWCIIEDDLHDNFDFIEIENDCFIVTMKLLRHSRETLLEKATNWFYGTTSNKCLTRKQFLKMFDTSTGRLLNETSFRQRIYDTGCEPGIRKIVWCYLFRIFDQTMTDDDKIQYIIKARQRYKEMKDAWLTKRETDINTLENLIDKDVTRTDSSVRFFENKRNLSRQKLLNILMTYCVYHPEPGYAQGMTDMAAPILYVIRDEALAYACFCTLMRYMGPLFHSNGIAINRRLDLLKTTIQAIDMELWRKIEQCDIGNLMFAYRWLLLDCKREFPFKDIFRVFETLWASLPIDRFELDNNSDSDIDDLCPSSICSDRHPSIVSSISNTILSSHSCSSTAEEFQSECSSMDERDSGYRDEQISSMGDFNINYSKEESLTMMSCLPLEKWLKDLPMIADESNDSDMFTIFLCMALLEQNRSSIMHVSTSNGDRDDNIGFYFTRLVRQNDAKQALQLARHYHRQYLAFQMRMKQFTMN